MQSREHQVAGESGFDGDLRRFLVACFTDEEAVGILPEKRTQDTREIEADIAVCLHLTEARKIIFDGVLCSRDVDLVGIDLAERAIQRRRLTGSCRSCDIDDSVRLIDHPPEFLDCWPVYDQLIQRQEGCA